MVTPIKANFLEMKKQREYKKYSEDEKLDFVFSYNDKETSELHAKLNGSTTITESDLRRVSLWKSGRVLSVSKETLA